MMASTTPLFACHHQLYLLIVLLMLVVLGCNAVSLSNPQQHNKQKNDIKTLNLNDVRLIECLKTPCPNANAREANKNNNSSTLSTIKVCGSDGRTYGSHCELKKANCIGHNVTIRFSGECAANNKATKLSISNCTAERAHAQDLARRPQSGVFVPRCQADGSFAQIQCYAAFDYCWCVDVYGRPIAGTSSYSKRPVCLAPPDGVKKRSIVSPNEQQAARQQSRRNKQPCSLDNRKIFNANLLVVLAVEYMRVQPNETLEQMLLPISSSSDKDDSLSARLAQIEAAKFRQLDVDKSGNLSHPELRAFRQLIKKLVQPRRCSRSFTAFCDLDQDNFITLDEWRYCLHVGIQRPALQAALERYYNETTTADNNSNVAAATGGGGGDRVADRSQVQPKLIGSPENFGSRNGADSSPTLVVTMSPEQRRLVDVTLRRAQQRLQQQRQQRQQQQQQHQNQQATSEMQPKQAIDETSSSVAARRAQVARDGIMSARVANEDAADRRRRVQQRHPSLSQTSVKARMQPARATSSSASSAGNFRHHHEAERRGDFEQHHSEHDDDDYDYADNYDDNNNHNSNKNNNNRDYNDDDDEENIWEAHLRYGRRRAAGEASSSAVSTPPLRTGRLLTAEVLPPTVKAHVQPQTPVGPTGQKFVTSAFDAQQTLANVKLLRQERRFEGNLSSEASIAAVARSCPVERQKAQLRQRTHSVAGNTVHVPECEIDGKFRAAQCHPQADFCWCVDVNTGVPVPGSSVPVLNNFQHQRHHQPTINCTNVRHRRHFDGCPSDFYTEFAAQLLEHIQRQRVDSGKSASLSNQTREINNASAVMSENEREVRWKFKQLDLDESGKLERREWLPLRLELRRHDRLRKCSRNFLRFCDTNGDHAIDVDEWINCSLLRTS